MEVLFLVEHCLVRRGQVHLLEDRKVNGHKALHETFDEVGDGHMDQALNGKGHKAVHGDWHLDGHGYRAIHHHWFLHIDRRMRES